MFHVWGEEEGGGAAAVCEEVGAALGTLARRGGGWPLEQLTGLLMPAAPWSAPPLLGTSLVMSTWSGDKYNVLKT